MSGLNNNYRIITKSTGAVVSTVSTNTFWSSVGGSSFFDPKTLYDPINDRWIVVMMSDAQTAASAVNIGVSTSSDPSGSYYLFRFDADSTNTNWADFPTIGFNKNYVAVSMNMFPNAGGSYVSSKALVLDYPALRAGTATSWWITSGPEYCSSPAATYSATEPTLYVPKNFSSAAGQYYVDTITAGASGPVWTVGGYLLRGVTWTQPTGNILPQAGAGSPLKIDCQDAQIRSTPVVRDGFIYYAQTVGLPAGGSLTHTAILWTKLTASTGAVADGGLIEDSTATATNGGKWYAYPSIAVNSAGDVIVGFSQFSSSQFASAGYAVRAAGDAAGTMRDPVVYKAGLDIYQKTYTGTRNRWGDYSKAQVDPSNDADLWAVQEYAKTASGTGADTGVWGTWWARVAPVSPVSFTVTASAGPGGKITPSGAVPVAYGASQAFTVTADTGYQVADVQVDGASATLTNGTYTFTNVVKAHTISATFSRPAVAITASAGPGGKITPSGSVPVAYGASQTFTVTPDHGYQIAGVQADGAPVTLTNGAYTFTNVVTTHTISATFSRVVLTSVLGKPSCPKSVKHGKKFTVSGSLSPQFDAGLKVVKVTVFRQVKRKWKAYKTWTAVTANSGSVSKYSVKNKLAKAGKYRFAASIAAAPGWTAATSGNSRTLKVK